MRPARRRSARRLAAIALLAALIVAVLLCLPAPKSSGRVPKAVAQKVALASFVLAGGALVLAERTLKDRREEEEADRILREELGPEQRNR